MPRKAPDQVIEHRISLSNFERSQIVEQLEKSRDSRLIASGISQVGAIAGSSLLLYGVGLYLGMNLFKDVKDGITDWVDKTSTTFADYLGDIISPNVWTTAEAQTIRSFYDRIDEAKLWHRNAERLNSVALNALVAKLRSGEITLAQFTAQAQPIRDEATELDTLRENIMNAYQHGRYLIISQRRIATWMGQPDWNDVVTAGSGWSMGQS